jgi:hypothetical protein
LQSQPLRFARRVALADFAFFIAQPQDFNAAVTRR